MRPTRIRWSLGKSGDPDNLDPAVTVTNNSWTAVYPCYERLVKFKVVDGKGSTDVEGDVATSWTASDDGKVWTFTLGDGHVFADGTPVNAAAIKFSFERILKVGKGPADAFDQIDTVEAVDDHTVQFTLKSPFAPFLASLVTDAGSIVNPAVMSHESDGDLGQAYLADHSMGSGPYQVTSWEKGQQIVLEPNPHYAGKLGFKQGDHPHRQGGHGAAPAARKGRSRHRRGHPDRPAQGAREGAGREGRRRAELLRHLPLPQQHAQAARRRARPPGDLLRRRLQGHHQQHPAGPGRTDAGSGAGRHVGP